MTRVDNFISGNSSHALGRETIVCVCINIIPISIFFLPKHNFFSTGILTNTGTNPNQTCKFT